MLAREVGLLLREFALEICLLALKVGLLARVVALEIAYVKRQFIGVRLVVRVPLLRRAL
jgi:hypothetical protein